MPTMHSHRNGLDAERAPSARRLLLLTARRGAESVAWANRLLRVDPDLYLIADSSQPIAAVSTESDTRPLLIELSLPGDPTALCAAFIPTLRSVQGAVGRSIAELSRQRPEAARLVLSADDSAALWAQLGDEELALRARAERIGCAKKVTREALLRRLLLSADFIQSHFAEPLRVEVVAAVSNLSPFHFARLFGLAMGETPHAFLLRKRLTVARRLLAAGLGRGDAAERAGFGCRSTLFRHLRAAAVPR
jgi:AraC-like DNA-binding protein